MVKIEYREGEKTVYCTFSGHLDTMTSISDHEALDRELQEVLASGDPNQKGEYQMVFDMKEVTFICSSFMKTCITHAKKLPPGGFSLINCDPFIKKTFKITGLDSSFQIS